MMARNSTRISTVAFLACWIWCVQSYTRDPCPISLRGHFQYPDCYVPRLDPNLALSKASFLMSHDAATGYLSSSVGPIHSAINLYAKTQRGTITDQLQSGARAFDLRPQYLQNKTVIFHHGAVPVPITFEHVVQEVKEWAASNPEELVLLFHSHATYQYSNISQYTDDGVPTIVEALQQIYASMGISYLSCGDVYGWTVGDAMAAGEIKNTGGSVIALDFQDSSLSMCAKMNWVESKLVTCYPTKSDMLSLSSSSSDSSTRVTQDTTEGDANSTFGIPPCTNSKSPAFGQLHQYLLESANNPASDDSSTLGPPASLDRYPFSEMQAMWQINAHAAASGIAHLSSLLDDTTKSNIHKQIVSWIHDEEFNGISVLAVDYVTLHGNAIFSVLRTQCGQSDKIEDEYCGPALAPPRIFRQRFSTMSWFLTIAAYCIFGIWIWVIIRHYFRHYQHERQMKRLEKDMEYAREALQCGGGGDYVASVD